MNPTFEQLKGTVSFYSNSPDQPTGYGQQARFMVDRLKRHGLDVAAVSNYGLEGIRRTLPTPYGDIPHFPRGFDLYSNDTAPIDHATWVKENPDQPDLLLTLYDVWVLQNPAFDQIPIAAWVPLDHMTMPPKVKDFLSKPNVTPIAMAPHGVRQMLALGMDCEYAPHGIDTKVMKPTFDIDGVPVEDFFGTKDNFVVGMVAANKASGLVHRKAFSENILAFSIFKQKHPDAVLYLHTDPVGVAGGWNLTQLIQACGLQKEDVIFPNPVDFRYGISQKHLAAYYTAMDVMLATSYGEGFGVPTIEAQACGTRVIGSNWAATPDLIGEDGWTVDGQPMFDIGQYAWWQMPNVPSIVEALEAAYEKGKGKSTAAREFALKFDVEKVWEENWMPILKKVMK